VQHQVHVHTKQTPKGSPVSAGGRVHLIKQVVFFLIVVFILLITSGSIESVMTWSDQAILVVIMIADALVMDPGLLQECSTLHSGTKRWDVPLSSFVALVGTLAVWVTAGFDYRFSLSRMKHLQSRILALFILLEVSLLGTWAMHANAFFLATVRIQDDRGHQVVTCRPYCCVRHPGYLGGIIGIVVGSGSQLQDAYSALYWKTRSS